MTDNEDLSYNAQVKSTNRTGKWTVEEEEYAAKLIDAFLSGSLGTVVDSEGNNCLSLRTFLAHKLRCRPMRISKKFPGCYYLGVIYEQQVFSSETIAAQKQLLKSYEKEYLEKDVHVQSQRLKRKKYLTMYSRKETKTVAHKTRDDTAVGDDRDIIEGNTTDSPNTKTSLSSQTDNGESSQFTETDPSSSDNNSSYSTDNYSVSESSKADSYQHIKKEYNDMKTNDKYSINTDSDDNDQSQLMKEVNNVMMILANAAEIVEEEVKEDH
mmetsp:Transcript_34583/g.35260  ORF Transcript_34583/g.35260 Transcript_34583/m.35260 type:complete len:268 (+) Transcript_34583:109-912(+)|eukprot:CAMPEP_0182428514 /NCGR_PEP_ID=MMETSP1167-20130531/23071_1 /TAXON_ID=2988 /ORGANISM="Mallomonas Sp, Strain CCMP3275" /LENGTH=267 /DNA_ID=CAMNT_0024611453 /DNA_START=72 /DNA_END=875 /DNA_ORIENTATION=+